MSKNNDTPPSLANTVERKTFPKLLAILFTLIYIVLFPLCCYIWPLFGLLFDNPRIATTFGFWIMSLTLLIPLSMPFSIYFIWSRYRRGLYEQVGLFCGLPLAVFMGIILIVSALLSSINSQPSYPVHPERSNNPRVRREQHRREFRERMKKYASVSSLWHTKGDLKVGSSQSRSIEFPSGEAAPHQE
jgi:hypothetical protein